MPLCDTCGEKHETDEKDPRLGVPEGHAALATRSHGPNSIEVCAIPEEGEPIRLIIDSAVAVNIARSLILNLVETTTMEIPPDVILWARDVDA